MRTAAGASMLKSDAALPFRDIVRNFDKFTQSIIYALVQFNKKLNPELMPPGDYDVIARGATSLIAKEVRGMQLDQLAQTLTDEEKDFTDFEKFSKARFEVRDMGDMLVSSEQAARNKAGRQQQMAQAAEMARKQAEADIRATMADAFKSITQGQKNTAAADAQQVELALQLLEKGLTDVGIGQGGGGATAGNGHELRQGVRQDRARVGGHLRRPPHGGGCAQVQADRAGQHAAALGRALPPGG